MVQINTMHTVFQIPELHYSKPFPKAVREVWFELLGFHFRALWHRLEGGCPQVRISHQYSKGLERLVEPCSKPKNPAPR